MSVVDLQGTGGNWKQDRKVVGGREEEAVGYMEAHESLCRPLKGTSRKEKKTLSCCLTQSV